MLPTPVDEVKLQAAARVAKNHDAETKARQIRERAERRAGEESKKIEKAPSGRAASLTPPGTESKTKVLAAAGISTQQASEFERVSDIPEEQFESALSTKSVHDLIDRPKPVDGDALLLYGMMHDFEERWLSITPAACMATMMETMIDDVLRIAERQSLAPGRHSSIWRVGRRRKPRQVSFQCL